MSEIFLGQVLMVGFTFAPKGFALCNGQTLPISQNQALFSILGTTYGGDGVSTFALPDLRSRTPIHFGADPSGNRYVQGQTGGEENHTLQLNEIPSHSHSFSGTSDAATTASPANGSPAVPGATVGSVYAAGPAGAPASPTALGITGGAGHPNLQPYLAINFVIALQGIFPTRN